MSLIRSKVFSKHAPLIRCDGCGSKLLLPANAVFDDEVVNKSMDEYKWIATGGRHLCHQCSPQRREAGR